MHLLATTSASLEEGLDPVDLKQSPGDIVILSFSDSDLTGLAAAWHLERELVPSLRLLNIRELKHPLSIDLWIDKVAAHAKIIVLRLLGGPDWWRYGFDRIVSLAQERGIALVVVPGEDRDETACADASTLAEPELKRLLRYFREGGIDNLRALLRRLVGYIGVSCEAPEPRSVPKQTCYLPGVGPLTLDALCEALPVGRPVVAIVFYRALLLAADTGPIDALCEALAERGLAAAPFAVTSLKDSEACALMRSANERLKPAVIVTTTAFAVGVEPGASPALEPSDAPILQIVMAGTRRTAWQAHPRGLGASDLAMHIVLPELDGRILSGVIAFKDSESKNDGLDFSASMNRTEPDRIAAAADRIAGLIRLRSTPPQERRVAMLIPDYPGAAGKTGYAVGLDVPASILAALKDMKAVGYRVSEPPKTSLELVAAIQPGAGDGILPIAVYRRLAAALPGDAWARVREAWGEPESDPDFRNGAFQFRARRFGNIFVCVAPDRGRAQNRRADYHDPSLPPRHALLAFGLWLRQSADVHAVVHMGAHGALEWLPGKAVALTASCFPELVSGALPFLYPFIVSNPGEAAQAKRRLCAVTIGHVPPPLVSGTLTGDARELERLIDEYAQADGLDRRRRENLARLIVDLAQRTGLAREAGVVADVGPDEALRRIDAWLCDIKDLAVKDGLHIFGRADEVADLDPAWHASAVAEREALLSALAGQRVQPGPAGAPARGRRDVLPTGRNLYTADPRTIPTQTAVDLGRLAADEVIRLHLQQHGELPRSLVIDLWGSATLRTGGEEIAQGLALMGCRPNWDETTSRITGITVLPAGSIGRPRVDVTWRISGLFRDLFPTQIALLDAAVKAVAAREEPDSDNPAAADRRAQKIPPERLRRIFGSAPGAYGAGIEDGLAGAADRSAAGEAYLDAGTYAYGGAEGTAEKAPGVFAERVAKADLLLHPADNPDRDLLEGAEDLGFVGGFAAAAELLGAKPDLVILDTSEPSQPRARSLGLALARIVRGRAVNERFITGQMRHGPRGASEFAETVDRLVGFAELTGAVSSELFDLIHDAYIGDARVRDFLTRQNPAAARSVVERLRHARERGFWHPRRNDIDHALSAMSESAAA